MALIAAAAALLSWTFAREDIRADVARHLFTLVTEVAKKAENDVATALRLGAAHVEVRDPVRR